MIWKTGNREEMLLNKGSVPKRGEKISLVSIVLPVLDGLTRFCEFSKKKPRKLLQNVTSAFLSLYVKEIFTQPSSFQFSKMFSENTFLRLVFLNCVIRFFVDHLCIN